MRFVLLLALIGVLIASPALAKNWVIDYDQSSIGFSGVESGQTFKGQFKVFQANVDLDLTIPAAGKITAAIDITSALTGNQDIDTYLPQPDWFSSAKFPKAQFASTLIEFDTSPARANLCQGRYIVHGDLSIKGISKPVSFPLCVTPKGDYVEATANFNLMRNDFGIGIGQWVGESVVKNEVAVQLDIIAK